MLALRTEDINTHNEVEEIAMSTAVSSLNILSVQSVSWKRVCFMTASDQDMLDLADLVENGIPDSQLKMHVALKDFFYF